MRCPYCEHHDDKVLDTRVSREGALIRRRRECLKCGGRYSTQETVLEVFPMVVKKDGRREPFNKDKILGGIRIACQKRPVSIEQMNEVIERVSRWVAENFDNEVPTRAIGERVMKEIFELDHVAYVRFASVYRQFKDIDEFMSELEATRAKEETSHYPHLPL